MDVPGGVLCIESHVLQKLLYPGLLLLPASAHVMGLQSFGNDVPHLHLGVKGGIGVLENDLGLLRKLLPFLSPEAVDVLSLIATCPSVLPRMPMQVWPQVVFPQPDSPTIPRVSPADKKRDVINGLQGPPCLS